MDEYDTLGACIFAGFGFTAVDDHLPDWVTRQHLLPHNTVFDVPGAEMDAIA